jgi:hypothetical protein
MEKPWLPTSCWARLDVPVRPTGPGRGRLNLLSVTVLEACFRVLSRRAPPTNGYPFLVPASMLWWARPRVVHRFRLLQLASSVCIQAVDLWLGGRVSFGVMETSA